MSSISGVLPQAAGVGVAAGPMGSHPNTQPSSVPPAQGTSQTPPRSTFSHHVGPIEIGPGGQISQTQHIHLGAVQVPPPGDIPPEGIQLEAGLPFALPVPFVRPGNIHVRPPQINIRFESPRNRMAHPNPGRPQTQSHLQRGAGRVVQPRQALGANIRMGPPRAGQISVVGFRMEGVPIHMAGGAALGLGNGPIITPEQQQLYQEHTQQQPPPDSGGQQNSAAGDQWNFPDDPPPPPSDDMELD